MIVLRDETGADSAPREALLDAVFGEARFTKPSERLRAGRCPAEGLALVAEDEGRLIATVRLWHVCAGGAASLLLGPLAVAGDVQGQGLGSALIRRALNRAAAAGHAAVLLVGDPGYYQRFGFDAALTRALVMPALVDPHRFQALEFVPGALRQAAGPVVASGLFTGADRVPGGEPLLSPLLSAAA